MQYFDILYLFHRLFFKNFFWRFWRCESLYIFFVQAKFANCASALAQMQVMSALQKRLHNLLIDDLEKTLNDSKL